MLVERHLSPYAYLDFVPRNYPFPFPDVYPCHANAHSLTNVHACNAKVCWVRIHANAHAYTHMHTRKRTCKRTCNAKVCWVCIHADALAIALAPAVGADMRRFEFSANLFAMADSSQLQELIWRAQEEFRVLLGDGGAAIELAEDHCESQLLPQLTEHKEVAGLLQQELAEECARIRNDAIAVDVCSGDEKDQQDDLRQTPEVVNVHLKAENLAHLHDAQACARAAETEPPSDPGGDVKGHIDTIRARASRKVEPPSDAMDDKDDKAPPRVRGKRRRVSHAADMPPSDAMSSSRKKLKDDKKLPDKDDKDDEKLLEDMCQATADPLPLAAGEWQDGTTDVRNLPAADQTAGTRYRLHGKQSVPRTSEIHGPLFGVAPRVYRALVRTKAPLILFQLLWFIRLTVPDVQQNTVFVDYYMGRGHLKEQFEARGHPSLGYEVKRDSIRENALTPEGLLTMVVFCLRLRDGLRTAKGIIERALGHWGTVCSSWIFVCKGGTGRTDLCPHGNESVKCVWEGNVQVSRMCLTLWLLAAKSVGWILEQPGSSTMEQHKRMQEHFRIFGVGAIRTWMGAYGGPHQKPTQLKGSVPWLTRLARPLSKNDRSRIGASTTVLQIAPHPDGRRRITGNGQVLKDTQEYPVGYAEAVADTFTEHYARGMHDVIHSNEDGYESDSDTMSEGELRYSEDDWADADLSGVYKLMAMDPKWVPPPLRV